jgi:hypothetical protein
VVEDAWSNLAATAVSLQGSSPTGSTKEVEAAYALRNASVAKNEANDFDSIDQTADDWLEALDKFHKAVRLPG